MPEQPGLYALTYDDAAKVEKIFSVNPPAKESELAYADASEAVKVWRLDAPTGAGRPVASTAQTRMSLRGILQQRLWWWMVLAGMFALMLETALAATRKEPG